MLLLFLLACGGRVAPPAGYEYDVPAHHPHEEQPSGRATSYPWEIWPLKMDLHGGELSNFYILRGDEALFEGRRKQALSFYEQAAARSISAEIKEALIMRMASCQLALDQPQTALSTLGAYFRALGRDESKIDPRFSLLLGYAYGRKGDYEQALAWLSRANKISTGSISVKRAASSGTSLLLRGAPDVKLQSLTEQWQEDPFVYSLIASEKRRRQLHGVLLGSTESKRPFWELAVGGESNTATIVPGEEGGTLSLFKVGVLLPLSGRFGNLGRSTKNGIDLAFSAATPGVKINALVRDTEGSIDTAIKELAYLVEVERVNLIIGPLLSEVAANILPLAKERNIPIITFSKKDNLVLGENLFRLGATVQSQVSSLLRAVQENLRLNRVALVYPNSSDGIEYAEAFRARAEELHLHIGYESTYYPNDPQALTSIAEELEHQTIDAVFFPDSLDRAAIFFSLVAPHFRDRVRILGPASWDNPTSLANSSSVLNRAVFVSPFFQKSRSALIARFNEAFQAKYSQKADFLAAQGFDAATMVMAALQREAQEGVSFLHSFQAIAGYGGLTGVIDISPAGEIERRFTVVSLIDGELQEIWPSSQVSVIEERSDGKG